jgi:iron only hydrogenase large subunit-like protein
MEASPFSVRVDNLSDYIQPSGACVVHLQAASQEPAGEVTVALARPRARSSAPQAPPPSAAPVKVTLHDCLACSGCITSAETVLLQQQSSGELLTHLADPSCCCVVSVSPQSRAALAARLGVSLREATEQLLAVLGRLGVRYVAETGASRELALLETGAELVARLADPGAGALPLLASACPGWVCYAEKSCGAEVLRHLSRVKSPQAVMGTLLKRLWAPRRSGAAAAQRLYHCALMPCYDKKLEASREDLREPGGLPETDCVLTTGELLAELWAAPGGTGGSALPLWADERDCEGAPWGTPGGGSGGYADAAARSAAAALWGVHLPPDAQLPWMPLRSGSADFIELALQPPEEAAARGAVALRFAAVYGFRNIQTIVRQLKRGTCPYHYVEVMACPGGCLSGGGQGAPLPGVSPAQSLAAASACYADTPLRSPGSHPLVAEAYSWLGGGPGTSAARALLHTDFHVREKSVIAAMNW